MAAEKWAVLIGVDVYESWREGHNGKHDIHGIPIEYDTLQGAVSDILRVRRHLIDYMRLAECRIKTLITQPWHGQSTAEFGEQFPQDGSPTYTNIIAALCWVFMEAKKDDLVYIHYSGHGTQATTVFPTLKGKEGLDEALVPTDANVGGKYIRDIEMALWLKKMVEKGLVVTVVLDSCHSGSATRGSGRVRFRAVKQTYKSTSEDMPSAEFMTDVSDHGIGQTMGVACQGSMVRDSWLVEPQGYTLLAACQARESAREYEDEDGEYHGALTYWLLDTLRKEPFAAGSMRNLYRRVASKVQSLFCDQTPFIGGTTDRAFLGTEVIPAVYRILVQKVLSDSLARAQEVEFAGGTLHGVRQGSTYGIYAFTSDEAGPMLARVEVTEVFPQRSVATLVDSNEADKIEPGCKAVLLSMPTEQQFWVGLSSTVDPAVEERFQKAWYAVPAERRAWMRLIAKGDPHQLTFHIDIDNSGNFEIQDRDGVAIPCLEPPLPKLPVANPQSPAKLVYRLKHLNLFKLVKDVENPNGSSTMRRNLVFEVGKSRDGSKSTLPSNWAAVEMRKGAFVATHNETLFLRIKNTWEKELYFVIFDLQPLFGVKQIHPQGGDSEPLDPGAEKVLQLTMTVPEKCSDKSCLDTLKAFGTPKPTPLGVLELADLCDAEASGLRGGSNNPLQHMLDVLRSPYRNGRPLYFDEWATEEITVRTFRVE